MMGKVQGKERRQKLYNFWQVGCFFISHCRSYTLLISYCFHVPGIWKESSLWLFEEPVQDHFYCWALTSQFCSLSTLTILGARFGEADSEMLALCNQIYSVRHNWQSFLCLSHLVGYFLLKSTSEKQVDLAIFVITFTEINDGEGSHQAQSRHWCQGGYMRKCCKALKICSLENLVINGREGMRPTAFVVFLPLE